MEILEAFDLTGSFRDAAELAGCSHHTVAAWVAKREAGQLPIAGEVGRRERKIDLYLPKVEEWVERSRGKIRADVVFRRLRPLGFCGSERTVRRAVGEAKVHFKNGNHRVYRPWIPEPGLWLQYDFGDGPLVDGVKTVLFCVWLAWSRFRIVLPLTDRTMGSVVAALEDTPYGRLATVTDPAGAQFKLRAQNR